jgi:hypothetical protein
MITTQALFEAPGMDARALELMVQTIESNNLPGFDFFEFKRAVAALVQMGVDENMAYKSAFTTASTLGLTKEKLIETAGYYRNLLDQESSQFGDALARQTQTKVTNRQSDIERLRDQVARHRADIVRLQEEVAAYEAQIEQGEAAAKIEADKIEAARAGFEKTHAAILSQIDRDIENIHKLV